MAKCITFGRASTESSPEPGTSSRSANNALLSRPKAATVLKMRLYEIAPHARNTPSIFQRCSGRLSLPVLSFTGPASREANGDGGVRRIDSLLGCGARLVRERCGRVRAAREVAELADLSEPALRTCICSWKHFAHLRFAGALCLEEATLDEVSMVW